LPDKQVALIRARHANWFVLDSLEKPLSVPGLLGELQLQWLASSLDSNRHKPALVLVHHNPDSTGTNSGLKDTDAFYQVIRPRKQVKAYFFGHTHVWKVEEDPSGLHLVNLPAVGYPFRAEQPTGWVQTTLERKGARLELRCTDPKHPAHGQIVELKWRG
jgi:3',5'-cyclic AMP phosphodiesterase CpdA